MRRFFVVISLLAVSMTVTTWVLSFLEHQQVPGLEPPLMAQSGLGVGP